MFFCMNKIMPKKYTKLGDLNEDKTNKLSLINKYHALHKILFSQYSSYP